MPTSYVTDIRPKFRQTDIDCMAPRNIFLGDQAWMCSATAANGFADHGNARHVYERLSAKDMPPDNAWSDAWLAVYESWMTDGFQP